MAEVTLTPEQKKAIKKYLQAFAKYVASDQFHEDQSERARRVDYFQRELPKQLDGLSETELVELIAELWASQIWGNKQYLAQKIISDNGIENVEAELKHLLDTSRPVGARYERFLKRVKGLGPASVTEILCSFQPDTCGIWNRKARDAIRILKLDGYVNPDKYQLSAAEYETFNQVLSTVAEELRAAKFKDVDLLFVDFFLYEVREAAEGPPAEPPEAFDHNEIRDLIQSIGVMLGFDADTEVLVGHGAKVDVVWRARIGNLGLVTYVLEVHKSGSMDSLLLNLQKAKSSPTVQKVVAVSDEAQLQKIKDESEGLPDEFRRALAFWRVAEVQKVAESIQSAMEVVNRLGLVQQTF